MNFDTALYAGIAMLGAFAAAPHIPDGVRLAVGVLLAGATAVKAKRSRGHSDAADTADAPADVVGGEPLSGYRDRAEEAPADEPAEPAHGLRATAWSRGLVAWRGAAERRARRARQLALGEPADPPQDAGRPDTS